jgi:hypothetical protein
MEKYLPSWLEHVEGKRALEMGFDLRTFVPAAQP